MSTDLFLQQEIDKVEAQQAAERRAESDAKADQVITQQGLQVNGPRDYDYRSAYADGASLQPEPDGGVNLPNKHFNNLRLGGYDLNTGVKYYDEDDDMGFLASAIEDISKGYVNTAKGPSKETVDGVYKLAAAHLRNGGTRETFKTPFASHIVNNVFTALEAQARAELIGKELANSPTPPPEQKEEGNWTLEDLKVNQEWMNAARIIANYEGDQYSDGELAERMLEDIVRIQFNTVRLGALIGEAEFGKMPEDVKQAYLTALNTVNDKVSMLNWDYVQGAGEGMLTDLPAWGIGLGVGQIVKLFGRRALTYAAIQRLAASAATKAAGTGAAIGGVEGGIYGGFEETAMQSLQDKYDLNKVFQSAGFGALGGAVLGGGLGALLSEPSFRAGKRFFNQLGKNMADTIGPGPSQLKAEVGAVGVEPREARLRDLRQYETSDDVASYGFKVADTNPDSPFYSRTRTAINARWGTAFGPDVNKEHDPATILKLIQDGGKWQSKKDAIAPNFSVKEAQDMGVYAFLEAKIAGGRKVSLREFDNFMYARRLRVNMNITPASLFNPQRLKEGNFTKQDTLQYNPSGAADYRRFARADVERRFIPQQPATTDYNLSDLKDVMGLFESFAEKTSAYGQYPEVFKLFRMWGDNGDAFSKALKDSWSEMTDELGDGVLFDEADAASFRARVAERLGWDEYQIDDMLDSENAFSTILADTLDNLASRGSGMPIAQVGQIKGAFIGAVTERRQLLDVLRNPSSYIYDGVDEVLHSAGRSRRTTTSGSISIAGDKSFLDTATGEIVGAKDWLNALTAAENKFHQMSRLERAQYALNQGLSIFDNGMPKMRYQTMTLANAPESRANYFEMRFYTPVDESNPYEIAERRFGKDYSGLSGEERKDVQQIVDYMYTEPFAMRQQDYHFSETGRFGHARGDIFYADDNTKVLTFMEVQQESRGDPFALDPVIENLAYGNNPEGKVALAMLRKSQVEGFVKDVSGDPSLFFGNRPDAPELMELFLKAVRDPSSIDSSATASKLINAFEDYYHTLRTGEEVAPSAEEYSNASYSMVMASARAVASALVNRGYGGYPIHKKLMILRTIDRAETPESALASDEIRDAINTPDFAANSASGYELMMHRLVQYAGDNEFQAVAFPTTFEQVARIEGWDKNPDVFYERKKAAAAGKDPVFNLYDKTISRLLNKKEFQSIFGAKKPFKTTLYAGADKDEPLGEFLILQIDPKKASSKGGLKPIMSVATAASAVAATQQQGEGEM